MSPEPIKLWRLVLILATAFATTVSTAQAKKEDSQQEDEIPTASIFGEAGERYVLYGTGGVTVDQSPKPGWIHSNMKVYKIRIDGGAGSNQAAASSNAVHEEASFNAAAACSYFVSHTATCTLPSAADVAGKEIVVCNTGAGITITYVTRSGETISGNQSTALVNSTPYQVDRFISDGKNWYKE
jgi:hypothetical protein